MPTFMVPRVSVSQATPSEGLQDAVQSILNPALRIVIIGKGCDQLAQPINAERGEVEWVEDVTLSPNDKPRRDACVLAAKLRHGIRPDQRCDDPGRHPRILVRLKHDDEGA